MFIPVSDFNAFCHMKRGEKRKTPIAAVAKEFPSKRVNVCETYARRIRADRAPMIFGKLVVLNRGGKSARDGKYQPMIEQNIRGGERVNERREAMC